MDEEQNCRSRDVAYKCGFCKKIVVANEELISSCMQPQFEHWHNGEIYILERIGD